MALNKINSSEDVSRCILVQNSETEARQSPSNIFEKKVRDNQKKYMNCIRPYNNKNLKKDKSDDLKSRKHSKSIPKNQPACKMYDSQMLSKRKDDLEQIYQELLSLKSEYKTLKQSYNVLIKEKLEHIQNINVKQQQITQMVKEIGCLTKQLQKYKMHKCYSDQELQRTKRQLGKLIEIENFRNKKLEETLQEKQLMILYLKGQIGKQNLQNNLFSKNFLFQSSAPIFIDQQTSTPNNCKIEQHKGKCPVDSSNLNIQHLINQKQETTHQKFVLTSISDNENRCIKKIQSQDSLSFSKDKSKSQHNQSLEFGISPKMQIPASNNHIIIPSKHEKLEQLEYSRQLFLNSKTNANINNINYEQMQNESSQSQIIVTKNMFKKKLKIFTDEKLISGYDNSIDYNQPNIDQIKDQPSSKKRSTTGLRSKRKDRKQPVQLEEQQSKSLIIKKKNLKINLSTGQQKIKKKKTIKNTYR